MLLLRQGALSMRLGVLALALSVTLSWTCASAGGLAGAAVGSVTAIYLEHVGALWRISRCTGIPWRQLQDWRSLDRKSTRLNSSHRCISYAVFCLKKKKEQKASRDAS